MIKGMEDKGETEGKEARRKDGGGRVEDGGEVEGYAVLVCVCVACAAKMDRVRV
jgi:hypothetical protein